MTVALNAFADVEEWRGHARALLQRAAPPELVQWLEPGAATLFEEDGGWKGVGTEMVRVPAAFVALVGDVVPHRDSQRFALLYRILWRLQHGTPRLMEDLTDNDVCRARAMAKEVSRATHKMKAFVRFRECTHSGEPVFVAWFEPEHYILERVAPFFVRRFTGMHWSVLTPYRSAHWDGEQLRYAPGASVSDSVREDAVERIWLTYYASIFNPARLNPRMMRQEMPQKFWKNLPEAQLLPALMQQAPVAVETMMRRPAQAPRKRIAVPERAPAAPLAPLAELRRQARACRACPLWEPATQTVFGEGPEDARIVLVGEQPGDQEDLIGRPFVGPAGKLLDRALEEAGIDRTRLYLTNAVKHFKFEVRGKVRLHKRANAAEQAACHQWLQSELGRLGPHTVLALGATAARAIFGPSFQLMEQRGRWIDLENGQRGLATVHPSYLLRLREGRDEAYAEFVADLRKIAE